MTKKIKPKVFEIGRCRTCLFRGNKFCSRYDKKVSIKRNGKWGFKRLEECKPDKYVSLNEITTILQDNIMYDQDEFGSKYADHIHIEGLEEIEKRFKGKIRERNEYRKM